MCNEWNELLLDFFRAGAPENIQTGHWPTRDSERKYCQRSLGWRVK